MIEGRFIGGLDEVDFKIEFGDENEVITDDDHLKDYLESIDETLDLTPLEASRDITFKDASEREMVIYLLGNSDFRVDEYPDDIELINSPEEEEDEDDNEILI